MTTCSPGPVWTAAYVWACACGHVHDHSGRRTINAQHAEHLEQCPAYDYPHPRCDDGICDCLSDHLVLGAGV